MAPSSSLQIPGYDTAPPRNNRPVSVTVNNNSNSSSPQSKKQRASHTVVSSSSTSAVNNSTHHTEENSSTFTDVYSHPAAIAYAAAHPRRTIPKFGPYLLLQTLGEGEFGKVKLGLHCQWGEEVAVKLIRRGNVDNSVRMGKVEREIEVLRTLKHPNIVRLYDVIETDKYIGIIIEYASGGELFDHILARRYLREPDAAKLFSQLISGVWYIHQKKIVHRDLKLENLLLDRHRNVIITDFGFANRFEHRADDLMQTSCGSPCYAAPELVISEGLYVGSAVDIWSCGVILYAMLAGYLPFDDDPANPDGDNINLLYKYIVNTPLTFPEYVSESARDLLKMMLVPDPSRRASLAAVMRHPWLSAYDSPPSEPVNPGQPTAFGRTVDELERMAMEQHQQKRRAYQMQMKAALASQRTTAPGISPSASMPPETRRRDQVNSHKTDSGYATSPTQERRKQDYLYETTTGMDTSVSSPAGFVSMDDPFAPPPGVAEKKHHHSGSGQRHTVQVEYDEPRSGERKRERKVTEEDGERKRARSRSRSASRNGPPTPEKRRRGSEASNIGKPLPSPPTASRMNASLPVPPITTPETVTVQVPPPPPAVVLDSGSEPPDTPVTFAQTEAAAALMDTTDEPKVKSKESKEGSAGSGASRHRRGPSAALGGLAKIFSDSSSSQAADEKEKEGLASPTSGKKSRRNTLTVMVEPISRTIKNRSKGRMTSTPLPQDGSQSAIEPPKSELPPPETPGPDDPLTSARLGASTTKAKGVMQWFRMRSKGGVRDSVGGADPETPGTATPITPPTATQSLYRKKNAASSSNTLLTSPVVPPRTPSDSVTPSFINRFRNTVTVSASPTPPQKTKQLPGGVAAMRIHHGAVDQSTITTRPPTEVMKGIREVLVGMGVEVQVEGEFKYRCIRAKRKKLPSSTGLMGSVGGTNVAAIQMAGSAASNGVDKRGLPLPSPSGTGGMLRTLLMRRQSSHVSSANVSVSYDDIDPSNTSLISPVEGVSSPLSDALYGDPTQDVGDEVRFSVELTRIDRLNDTYSVDIRRLKGNLRSYKFLYDTIRQRADLR